MIENILIVFLAVALTILLYVPYQYFLAKRIKLKNNRILQIILLALYCITFLFSIWFSQGVFKETEIKNEHKTIKRFDIYLAREKYFDNHIPYILNDSVYEKLITDPMNEGDKGGRIITKYITKDKKPYAIIENKKWQTVYPESNNIFTNMGISCSKFLTFRKRTNHSWNEVTLYVPVNYNHYLDVK